MPANIEIKAHARNFEQLKARAAALSDGPGEIIKQQDTFFVAPQGRLKLREFSAGQAQLIYYTRSDQSGPKRSEYRIYQTGDAENLKAVLELAYGIRGVVRKTRHLYLVGQTRLHLDDVAGLGQFIELEVVLRSDQTDAQGQAVAEELMQKLGLTRADLLEGAYMDLIEGKM